MAEPWRFYCRGIVFPAVFYFITGRKLPNDISIVSTSSRGLIADTTRPGWWKPMDIIALAGFLALIIIGIAINPFSLS